MVAISGRLAVTGETRCLAQVNVARQRADLVSPVMGELLAALDPVNRIADQCPGFVWRLQSEESHGATTLLHGGHPVVVNLSVWQSYEELHAFAYRSLHGAYLRQRSRWFHPTPPPSTALWWVKSDDRPTVEEALRRLRYLRAFGPSPQAFTMRQRFDPDGRPTRRGRHLGR